MKNMNCVSTMPEIMPEITDEAIIESLFAQRPYEEKVINSAFLEIGEGRVDGALGDLGVLDTQVAGIVPSEHFLQVPGYGLPLAVKIS